MWTYKILHVGIFVNTYMQIGVWYQLSQLRHFIVIFSGQIRGVDNILILGRQTLRR